MTKNSTKPNRRQFLAAMAATAATACNRSRRNHKQQNATHGSTPPRPATRRRPQSPQGTRPSSRAAGRGQIFAALHEHALDKKDQPAPGPVGAMLDHLMRELTGKSRIDDAWATLFKPTDTIGIKPNCRGGPWCSPSPALMDAVIARLLRIGVKSPNIIVWELSHFAEHPLYGHLKKRTTHPIQMKLQDELGFHSQTHKLTTGKTFRFNNAIHQVDALINIAAFKDHGRAGVTGALKNLAYGSINNPRDHHDNCCNPSAAEMYNQPVARDKVRLTLADAFRLIYDKGPTGFRSRDFNVPFNRLYATFDPVALDRECWQAIDTIRKTANLPLLMNRTRDSKPIGRPHHVETAAKLGLGEADYAKIKVTQKKLG